MGSLAASIKEVGVLQPVLVREVDEGYELVAGERRWRAAKRAGLQTMPVLVQTTSDVQSLEQALVENLHREDLGALEEASAYQQLVDEFGYTHEQVASRAGKSRTVVTNTLRLFQLPAGVQRALADGAITAGHARALLGTPDRSLPGGPGQEDRQPKGLTVRAVEESCPSTRLGGEPERAGRAGSAYKSLGPWSWCPAAGGPSHRTGWPRTRTRRAAPASRPGRARARGTVVGPPQHQSQGRHGLQAGPGRHRLRHPGGLGAHLQVDGWGERPESPGPQRSGSTHLCMKLALRDAGLLTECGR